MKAHFHHWIDICMIGNWKKMNTESSNRGEKLGRSGWDIKSEQQGKKNSGSLGTWWKWAYKCWDNSTCWKQNNFVGCLLNKRKCNVNHKAWTQLFQYFIHMNPQKYRNNDSKKVSSLKCSWIRGPEFMWRRDTIISLVCNSRSLLQFCKYIRVSDAIFNMSCQFVVSPWPKTETDGGVFVSLGSQTFLAMHSCSIWPCYS